MKSGAHVVAVAALVAGCGGVTRGQLEDDARPGPAEIGAGVKVFSGRAATLESGEACTAEEGATGDRWCGFVALSSEGQRNLYVVNVSQVIAGVPVSCDVPDANCLLLTEDVQGSGANWHATFFAGDTLVYYDVSLTPHAWRPGMESGRLLVNRPEGVDIVFCAPAWEGLAVACLGLPDEREDPSVRMGDLYVGTADGETEPLLAPLDRVIVSSLDDQDGVQRFSYGFPVSGYIAWTSREEVGGPEVLKVQRVDDPESRITVASDVHDWDVSDDGSSWFWLSAFDSHHTGLLQRAPFPDGTDPVDVLPNASDFGVHSMTSLVALTADADVVSIADPVAAPESHVLVDQGMKQLNELSDHGHVAYSKTLARSGIGDLIISKLDGTRACVLDTSVTVPLNSIHFSSGPAAAVWARAEGEGYDAYVTRLADCSSFPVAPAVSALGWIGKTSIVFMDEFDAEGASGSIHFRKVGQNGKLDPAPKTLVSEHVRSYASAGSAVIYSVSANDESDGVYVRAFPN